MKRVYPPTVSKRLLGVGIASAMGLLFSVFRVVASANSKELFLLLVCWTVVPPAWFAVEYFEVFKRYGTDGSLEDFKYGQDIASKVWLSMVAIITAKLIMLGQQ